MTALVIDKEFYKVWYWSRFLHQLIAIILSSNVQLHNVDVLKFFDSYTLREPAMSIIVDKKGLYRNVISGIDLLLLQI
jgi:hypothetical protein